MCIYKICVYIYMREAPLGLFDALLPSYILDKNIK